MTANRNATHGVLQGVPTLKTPVREQTAARSFRGRAFVILAILCALTAPLAAAHSQGSAVVDEGTFSVAQNGVPLGRESFRIVRAPAPGGQVYRAQGQNALGENRVTTSLSTDSSGTPVSYEATLTRGNQLALRLQGKGRPGRFGVLAQSKTGESVREYVLDNGALIMDEDVFHHFYFVPLAAQHAEIIVISPRSAQQIRLRLEQRGEEGVEIAGQTIAGRRFALVGTDGERHVWVDGQGRLLKVSLPQRGLIALRDDPPR